jgi:hypothetical protein
MAPMRRSHVLSGLSVWISGCAPSAPSVAFEDVRTTPGARVHGGPGFATGTADATGVALAAAIWAIGR